MKSDTYSDNSIEDSKVASIVINNLLRNWRLTKYINKFSVKVYYVF